MVNRRNQMALRKETGGKHKGEKDGYPGRCVQINFSRKPLPSMGEKEWYCRFCSETNVWTRWRCRSILSRLQGKYRQAVSANAGGCSTGSSSSSGKGRRFFGLRKLCNDDHELKLDAPTHRRPTLRRGRRHHGGFAMKLCLDAELPMRERTIYVE